jgi:16S rRNA (uracil1498-N3)-methyltransferase
MSNRFYIDPLVSRVDGDYVLLCGDEVHHFSRVMRGKCGDEIFLFDGLGGLFRGVVDLIRKDQVGVRLTERLADNIESTLNLTIASALPKGDRQKFLIEKLAELGVKRFIPIRLERSVAKADANTISRFKRYVIEAAKQCGRNFLMEISDEISINTIADNIADQSSCLRLLLHPVELGDVGQTTPAKLLGVGLASDVVALVGPEGSFTDREVAVCLAADFKPIELGKRILRTETACIAIASLLLTYAG